MTSREATISQLWRSRPRNRVLVRSTVAIGVLVVAVAATTDLHPGLSERRLDNLQRFLARTVPEPLQGKPFDLAVAWQWVVERMADGGLEATLATLSIAVVAIVLAMLLALLLAMPAARNVATAEPFVEQPARPGALRQTAWTAVVIAVRATLVWMRSIPEYVWAFLLIAMLGVTPWAAILALALHNAGILGRLCAEVVENTDPRSAAALRSLGASRRQIAAAALLPDHFNRFTLFFFYRFETCVREATVLGMLGIASLGFLIDDAKRKLWYDDMMLYVLAGATLVLAADIASRAARRLARQ